jgi:hypothetical protein
MGDYVCPVHEEEILFPSDVDSTTDNRGKKFSLLPLLPKEMPRLCYKCNIFYYRYECVKKEV